MAEVEVVGFTGTGDGMTEDQKDAVLGILMDLKVEGAREIHLGDCVGADTEAHEMARLVGYQLVGHPPDNGKSRSFLVYDVEMEPIPYLARNRAIVAAADILVATPNGFTERLRSGTWATVRYARKAGVPVTIVYPDGTRTVGKETRGHE